MKIGLNIAFRPRNDESAPVKWQAIEVEQVDSELIASALEAATGLAPAELCILRANVVAFNA